MTQLMNLIRVNADTALAVKAARLAHEEALRQLHEPLRELYVAYKELFEPLITRAERLDYKIDEVCEAGMGDWASRGLIRVDFSEHEGFATITTLDIFRGESDHWYAYLPAKYLAEDGRALMNKDVLRIKAELAALEAQQSQSAQQETEERERAELARLAAKWGMPA